MEEEKATFRDWADGLPLDLVARYGELVLDFSGYVSFRAVCRSWRAALPDGGPSMKSPWVVIPFQRGGGDEYGAMVGSFVMYSLPTNGFFVWDVPGGASVRCAGANGSWLALVDAGLAITLVNPLVTTTQLRLPPLRPVGPAHDLHVHKVAFSPSPTARDYAVAVLDRRGAVAFTRAGSDGWHWVETPPAGSDDDDERLDIAWHDGKFYYTTPCARRIRVIDAGSTAAAPVPAPFANCIPPGPDWRSYSKHLVFSDDGVLHLVWRDGPRVLVQEHRPGSAWCWKEVRGLNLGGCAFMVGNSSQSVSVPVPLDDGGTWLFRDRVYYITAEDDWKPSDMPRVQVHRVIGAVLQAGYLSNSASLDWDNAVWLLPSMCK